MSTPNVSGYLRNIATFLARPSIGEPSRATLLVRLAVGGVLLPSGLVKFLFDNQGPGSSPAWRRFRSWST
jgi:hypothetical protein